MDHSIVAVTGGTGFIGRHLVRLLLSKDKSVRVFTRDIRKAKALLPEVAEYFEGDLSDAQQIRRFLSDADYVFHLASELKDKKLMYKTNVLGTKNILNSIRQTRPKKYIHLSSAGVTGQRKYLLIDEETPCSPCNEYEQSKLEAEEFVLEFAAQSDLPVAILRPTNVIGEEKDNPEDSFYQLIRQIKKNRFFYIGQGKGAANYVYVLDVAGALIFLSESDTANGAIFIINNQSSMRDIVEHIKTCCQLSSQTVSLPFLPVLAASTVVHAFYPGFVLSPSRVRALHSPYQYSSQKIEKQLGFRFEYGIKNGLKRTIEWLEGKGWL
jgi:nucleoside-diphosphate-sugar epimerase